MAYGKARELLAGELEGIRRSGLYKQERQILGPQGPAIRVQQGEVLNFCANNYLGLANHPRVIAAARAGLDRYGYGLASGRFICGTQDLHLQLERRIAEFLRMDDAILYTSCFDANGGLFETLLGDQDAVISDELNHASIIDGIRLCKATRQRYRHLDMAHLEELLKESSANRLRLIATDGVFSMDGDVAPLGKICDLAERYDALVMVDDSHATGFFGPGGRGTPADCQVEGRVDIITSTLGKALGGACGGFTAARREIVDLLRQRSRPYIFSNSLPPPIAAAATAALDLISEGEALRERLRANTTRFREEMPRRGFKIRPGVHPIVPILLGEAVVAQKMAARLLEEGVYVIGFFFPVVPQGQARIRVQLSAAHTPEQVDRAIAAFAKVGAEMGLLQKA
jgi:glycine C-acetyltransferase